MRCSSSSSESEEVEAGGEAERARGCHKANKGEDGGIIDKGSTALPYMIDMHPKIHMVAHRPVGDSATISQNSSSSEASA